MQNFLLTHVLLALSIFHIAAFAAAVRQDVGGVQVIARQLQPAASTFNSQQCAQYSQTANFSTIGANSTYRAAFFGASPVGTAYNAAMFDKAIRELPALTRNTALNAACGNLTTIALTEAERNFTRGVVGQFSGIQAEPLTNGIVVVVVCSAAIVMMCGTWSLMP